ncbi:MAG: hypothetical protein WCW30_01005 [Candidatus Gracilibacteria bacterium]
MKESVSLENPNKVGGNEGLKMEAAYEKGTKAQILEAVGRKRLNQIRAIKEVGFLKSLRFGTKMEAMAYLCSHGFSLLKDGIDDFGAVFRENPCAVLAGQQQSDGTYALWNVAIVGIHTGKLGVTDGEAAVFLRKHKPVEGSKCITKCIRSLTDRSQFDVTV